ncbi:MAG: glycosyltransferase family 2 protein [Clostridia bacterium]|nr:glycosyltransferase family 2 protein [Clostridia bacterium]
MVSYNVIYTVIGFIVKAKTFPAAKREHSYGIIISARNESAVIGNLLDSIAAQRYDMSKIKVFVVADNCNDDTADVCRSKGAIVYERHDPSKARKGYALEFLFENIARDYGIESLEGYLFFDADNLLHPEFLSEINKAFDTGVDVAVGYRSTKNFSTNFISAAYGIHFCRSSMNYHRPRCRLGLPTHIAGTGYVMKSEILKDGWHFDSLTEDAQFTLSGLSKGIHIEFCESAEFFDEQPYRFKVMVRQRLRWAKGRLFCFFRYAAGLIKGIFIKPKAPGGNRFACYDMFCYALPKGLISVVISAVSTIAAAIATGINTSADSLYETAIGLLTALASAYAGFMVIGLLTAIREHKHIICPLPKLVLYVILFPIFDLMDLPVSIASLFMRVKWKPIKHDQAIKIDELVSQEQTTTQKR